MFLQVMVTLINNWVFYSNIPKKYFNKWIKDQNEFSGKIQQNIFYTPILWQHFVNSVIKVPMMGINCELCFQNFDLDFFFFFFFQRKKGIQRRWPSCAIWMRDGSRQAEGGETSLSRVGVDGRVCQSISMSVSIVLNEEDICIEKTVCLYSELGKNVSLYIGRKRFVRVYNWQLRERFPVDGYLICNEINTWKRGHLIIINLFFPWTWNGTVVLFSVLFFFIDFHNVMLWISSLFLWCSKFLSFCHFFMCCLCCLVSVTKILYHCSGLIDKRSMLPLPSPTPENCLCTNTLLRDCYNFYCVTSGAFTFTFVQSHVQFPCMKKLTGEPNSRESSEKKPPSLQVFWPLTSDTVRGLGHTQVMTLRCLLAIFLRTVLDLNPHPHPV